MGPRERRHGRESLTARATLAALLVAVFVVGGLIGWRRGGPPDVSRWEDAIQRAAAESDVPPDLLRALVAAESSGRPGAASAKGAKGLLQIVPATAQEQARLMGIEVREEADLYVPETNLRLGAGYLARMLRLFDGDEVFAVAAYNAGPTPVRRWRSRAPELSAREVILREGYQETRRHVVRVLAWRDRYRE